ncbi:GDSL esterase/lipase At1g71691 [Raphanus sativus]|uniref:GDSL esterase/lipase At1g71691 n=1 Tax=Raphanus sativus TaxID=3726 RepID=A0A9W3CKR9_RAPSA|nr:GDSL esterase/lipase At1g71691 [Raphanus sativus]
MAFHFRRLCLSSALLALLLQLLHGVSSQLIVVEDPVSAPPPPLVVVKDPVVAPPPTLFEQDGSVPALFIFGDSLIDNGNNNNIPSFAKANYFPYGIDFNGGPTGRFCNGLTMVDGIAQLLGLPLVPAYSDATGDQVLRGVNYASAAAGILPDTGGNFVGRIPFDQQIHNFETTLDQVASNYGGAVTIADSVARSLFFIGMGSNDYLNNYLMPNFPTRNQYNAQQFGDLLVQQYTNQLTRLYNLGGRKFIVSGLGRMGCIPSILAQGTDGKCSEEVNQLVLPFNTNVKTMITNLNQNLPDAKFIYLDTANMVQDITTNQAVYGLTTLDKGCCGIGRNRGQITCLPFETPCPNRDQYLFWDAFHPTEKVNLIMAKKAFAGDRTVAFPINIQELASLN